MNLNLKAIGAVAVLALSAGAANAALVLPNTSTGSDLTFNIWNADTQSNGYTLDLGINASALSSGFSVTLSGAALASFNSPVDPANGGGSVATYWNVVGAKVFGGVSNYFTTVTSTANASDTAGQAQSAAANLGTVYQTISTYSGNTFGASATGSVSTTPASGLYWAASLSQGSGQINNSTDIIADTSGTDTSSTAFFKALNSTGTVETVISGVWSLVFNAVGGSATSATLTWTPTAVPLPAAVWLLGSALLGLAGVSRRRLAVSSAGAGQFSAA